MNNVKSLYGSTAVLSFQLRVQLTQIEFDDTFTKEIKNESNNTQNYQTSLQRKVPVFTVF